MGRWICWTMLASLMLVFAPADSTVLLAQGPLKRAVVKRWHRLPAYYAPVVTEEQRAAIYKIQEEYGPKIAALKEQIAALKAERNEKIQAVLTPEQQQQVKEAKKKRQGSKAAKHAGKVHKTTPPADVAPEEPSP